MAVVDGVRSGKIACGPDFSDIDKKLLPRGVLRAWALRSGDGSVLIMFFTVGTFPLHHEGYLFEDCKGGGKCVSELNSLKTNLSLRPVTTNWDYFSG